ncbi:MAG: 30S ribosomal protein S16 [Chitinivibrionales bacterium]|nr:30S ribosomal protein S16 [Chitinivibrionales bacterium]
MSVTIRLTRTGTNNIARYRLVAADHRFKRDGRFLEMLGSYNPQANPKEFSIKTERVIHWLKQGARPSETVMNLLKQDRFFEKMEGLKKGLTLDSLNITRKAEPKKKAKKVKKEAKKS